MTKFFRVVRARGLADLTGCAFTERQIVRALANGVLKPGMRFSCGTTEYVLLKDGVLEPFPKTPALPDGTDPMPRPAFSNTEQEPLGIAAHDARQARQANPSPIATGAHRAGARPSALPRG